MVLRRACTFGALTVAVRPHSGRCSSHSGPTSTLPCVTGRDDEQEGVRLRRPIREPDGFVALYRRESEVVLVFCARRVLDAQLALDLTAETFAQAYRGRRGFRGRTEPEARAWLLTIARRQIARSLERAATDRRLVERLGVQIPRMDTADVEELERRAGLPELCTIVSIGLERLSEDQQSRCGCESSRSAPTRRSPSSWRSRSTPSVPRLARPQGLGGRA